MRETVRKDLIQFAAPAVVVFSAGLIAAARDGYEGTLSVLWRLLARPASAAELPAPTLIGVTLVVVGLAIAIASAFTLRGAYASTLIVRDDQRLVTQGIYRFVRHPIYAAVIVACLGLPIQASSWLGAAIMALLIPIFIHRIRMEEKMLVERFGDEYRAYQAATRRLIPFVY